MKKLLSLTLLLGSLFLANVQGQIGFIYNGQTYTNGASFTVTLAPTAHNCSDIQLKNMGYSALQNLVITITAVEDHGVNAWGLCAGGVCIPRLTSNPFNLTPGAVDTSFSIDLDIDNSISDPYGIYTIEVSNGTITNTVTVRFQTSTVGIDNVAEKLSTMAYPNPAQGAFSIRYEVEQPTTLAIVDMQGRTVRSIPVEGNGSVNVNDLPAGMYVYGIAGGKMQKLIVK